MNAKFDYHSIYAPYFDKFIAMKQSLGCISLQTGWIFLEFDNFFQGTNVTTLCITREMIDQWRVTRINDGSATLYLKYSIWSQFSRFMCKFGFDCHIPKMPAYLSKNSFTPYIFSNQQMSTIFCSCDNLRIYDRHMSAILFIIPAIIRLLYGTGLRISEALSLKNRDVDFNERCLHVRKSKNGEERVIPLSDMLIIVLKQYRDYRNQLPVSHICDKDGCFFISPNGRQCLSGTVYTWFRKVLSASCIPHQGEHKGPRVHDLRHTFAVHSLARMAKSGMDLYYSLPLLSTFLGHKSLDATEQYVRLTSEMYPDLLNDEKALCAYVFPKINNLAYDGNN